MTDALATSSAQDPRTSPKGRMAMLCGGLAVGMPVLGWIGFAVGATASFPDAAVFGSLFAMGVGGVGFMGALLGLGLAISELRDAARSSPPRSRLAGRVALTLVLLAPVTWAIEWALAALWFLSSMPSHIL